MRFSKNTGGFYPENIDYPNLPDDLVFVSDDDYCALLNNTDENFEITADKNGYPILSERVIENVHLVEMQYIAIDAHISQCIKSNGWDYDNLGELIGYAILSKEFKNEANAIWEWVESCQAIQTDIKKGVVKYDSVEAAISALPPFDIEY